MTPRRGECKSTFGRVPLLSRFQIEYNGIIFQRFPSQAKKNTEIPFSNRRYWHYFPEKPKKTRKARFQMRFPSQAQEKGNYGIFRFQIEDIDIIFQRLPWKAKKKTTEIPFSNRRYCHYFPEVTISSPKKGNSRFQIEDIVIIFQRFPSQAQKKHGNSVFK